jgi:uncharacterized membrane protein YczE
VPHTDPVDGTPDPRRELRADLGPVAQLRAGRLPRRLVQLYVGLALYGVSLAMLVRATLGVTPWDVLHQGLALHLPMSFGMMVILVSFAVLLVWIPLRQPPGLGTISNAVVVGLVADLTLALTEAPEGLAVRVLAMVAAVGLNGLATAMYIGSQLGPGPRDGLMTGLARVSGRSLRLVRTLLEVTVVLAGFALGGVVGVGTVLYALAIGPVTQALLPGWVVQLPRPGEDTGDSARATGAHRRDED